MNQKIILCFVFLIIMVFQSCARKQDELFPKFSCQKRYERTLEMEQFSKGINQKCQIDSNHVGIVAKGIEITPETLRGKWKLVTPDDTSKVAFIFTDTLMIREQHPYQRTCGTGAPFSHYYDTLTYNVKNFDMMGDRDKSKTIVVGDDSMVKERLEKDKWWLREHGCTEKLIFEMQLIDKYLYENKYRLKHFTVSKKIYQLEPGITYMTEYDNFLSLEKCIANLSYLEGSIWLKASN